ncbi:pectinesterase family protein [Planosporangium sp. 12N6]|uniref:pectinesterase family protein n=1 Tax=Planosporangium spinosum TaxID=3402278 RepID=UPI003CEE19F6
MHRNRIVPAVGAAALLGATTLAVAGAGPAAAATSVTVARDGTGTYRTVQAAVDAVPAGNGSRFTITIKPGTYHEIVNIPSNKPYVMLVGSTGNAADVVIEYDNASGTAKPGGGTYGTSGSASVTISGHDFGARNVTFANTFNEAAHPEIASQQAVAVNTQADRAVFDNVRFLGNQDTLLAWSASAGTVARAYFRSCYVEGDVDFIFGRGTAVFDRCTIKSLSRGSTSNNGYVTAAATANTNPYGFLFSQCTFTSNAPAQTGYLGRPWHPSGDPNAIGQVLVRDSALGAHIKSAPWTDMSGFSWRDARFSEYHNTGAGAGANANRPQLSDAQAPNYTPQRYLAGGDGWNPVS